MRRARVALATALATAAITVAKPSRSETGQTRAETGATLVAVVTSDPTAPLTRRVSQELRALGVDVIVIKPPAEGSALRAPLEQAARAVGAIAAVRLVASSAGKVEVWVADRVTGKAVVRELDAGGGDTSDAAVALGTVELFRASLMELHAVEAPHGEVPITEKVRSLALPAPPPVPRSRRLGLEAGGATDLGVRGLGPAVYASVAVWVRVASGFGVRLAGYLPVAPAHATTAQGSIDVRSELYAVAATWDFGTTGTPRAFVPRAVAGVAAAHVSASGSANAPFVSATDEAWFAAPLAGAGLAWAAASGLRLRGDGLVAWAFPSASIRTPTTTAGRWAAPAILLSLGIEVLWTP
jgi:hypothetical protein